MTDLDYLKPVMVAWKQACLSGENKAVEIGNHIAEDDFYDFAAPRGMEHVPEEIINHLSACPVCLEKWARWRQAVSDVVSDDYVDEQMISYGMLKAAAGKEQKEAVNIKSNCGRFILGVYPDKDTPKKALVVLEFIESAAVEGKTFVVRDNKGNTLIDGSLKQGRIARVYEDMSKVDLSKWTLVEK